VLRLLNRASAIYGFGSTSPKADSVPPDDPVLEIPLSEFQDLMGELAATYNQLAELVRDAGIIRGHELAKMTTQATDAIKAARSPPEKILLLNVFMRRLLARIRGFLKTKPSIGRVVQVCSKIMARAIQIIDYLKIYGSEDANGKRDVSLDSRQARFLFSGKTGQPVSRRDTIRAMKRAEALWPALNCGHRPNDGRQTVRLTISREDLKTGISPEFDYCDLWQRSKEKIGISL
jgi:hypothetical protein